MDYTIPNNSKLFDELLAVLERHAEEPKVAAAIDHLRAAKVNYVQRSLDHMINSLVLVWYDLSSPSTTQVLRDELNAVISAFVQNIFEAPAKLRRLAEEYEKNGGKLLTTDEILAEVNERRGLRG